MITRVVGPWSSYAVREGAIRDLKPATRERVRKFRWGGQFFLEIWPDGTKPGDPGIQRGDMPSYAALPPLNYIQSPNYSARTEQISGIVWHETEGAYLGAVGWLTEKRSEVSAHIVLREDGRQATQLVPYSLKAWHASNANSHTIGIELAGFTAKGNALAQLQAASRIGAVVGAMYGIPARDATARGYGGHTTHRALGSYGGGHGDPGGFDFELLVHMIAVQTKKGNLPKSYGKK